MMNFLANLWRAAAVVALLGAGPAMAQTQPRVGEETGGTASQEPALSDEETGGFLNAPQTSGTQASSAAPEALPTTAPLPKPDLRPRDPTRGPVTNLPLPRFVTLKTGEGNARRGPGLSHRIDWVFKRAGMPLRVTAEYENWRRVEDQEGLGGWVHYSLLSGVRSVLVQAELAEFRAAPDTDAEVIARAERGVIGRIMECNPDWCRLSVEGEKGWVSKAALWGVDAGEVIE